MMPSRSTPVPTMQPRTSRRRAPPRHRSDHLATVPDDALALDRGAHHEAWHVGQEQQWHVEGVAQLDEPGGLVRGVEEQHPALEHRVVRYHPDDLAVEPGEAGDKLPGPQRMDLEQ